MGIFGNNKTKKESLAGGSTYTWDNKGNELLWKLPKNVVWNDNIVVREDEWAIFMRDGKALKVFDRPGRYALTTQNVAAFGLADILQNLTGVRQIGEVIYIQRRELRGKFGTKEPIAFRDKDFGIVRIRAFGQYSYRVSDPLLFVTQFIGTENINTTAQVNDWFRDQIVMSLNDILGELKRDKDLGIIDVPAYLEEMEQLLLSRIDDDTRRYGVQITKLSGLNFNLPDKVQEAIDKRGELQALGVNYMQYQAGEAMVRAADNPSGGGNLAGMGVGLGAGLGMGAGMAQAVQVGMQPQADNPWEDKDSAGSVKCPKCGAEVKPGERFCGKCGHQLVKESTCVKCGKPIKEGVKFCPHCGAKQTLECPKCGKEVASGTKFCPECGTELKQ